MINLDLLVVVNVQAAVFTTLTLQSAVVVVVVVKVAAMSNLNRKLTVCCSPPDIA